MTHTSVPDGVESAKGKLVCLYLATGGPATVEEMAAALRLTLSELLAILRTLAARSLVVREGDGYALA